MMLRYSIAFFFLLFVLVAKGQQLPLIGDYAQNGYIVNPAMTGDDQARVVSALYRRQWQSMPDGPHTGIVSFRNYFEDANMALGGYLIYDQTGPTGFAGINLAYSYHILFDSYNNDQLSIGIHFALHQYRLRGELLNPRDEIDQLIIGNNRSKILPDAGVGVLYSNDYFFGGVSVPQIISMNVKFEGDGGLSNIRRISHFYGMAGGKIPFGYDHVLEPSAWVKYAPHSPIHADFQVKAIISELLIVGLAYSTAHNGTGMLGVQVDERFRFTYSMSYPFNPYQSYLGFSHELGVHYYFEKGSWYY